MDSRDRVDSDPGTADNYDELADFLPSLLDAMNNEPDSDASRNQPSGPRRNTIGFLLAFAFLGFFSFAVIAPVSYGVWYVLFGQDAQGIAELERLRDADPATDAAAAIARGDFRLYGPIVDGEPYPLDFPPAKVRRYFKYRYVRLLHGDLSTESQALNNAALGYLVRYNFAIVEAAAEAGYLAPQDEQEEEEPETDGLEQQAAD